MIRPNLEFGAVSEATDEKLMQRIARRKESALEELMTRHGEILKAVAGRVVREEGEADDVLQESLLQIWREASRYMPRAGKPLAWLTTVTRRRAIDMVRRRGAYNRAKERFEAQQVPLYTNSRTNDAIAQADLRRFLREQMKSLPRHQSEAIRLAFFKGMSHREIAAATRTPLGTVKTRLELGLRKLTQKIRPLRRKI